MIIGYVIAVVTILVCCMFLTKRIKNNLFQRWNHKTHKISGFLALVLSIVHLLLVWPLRLQRPWMMFLLGFVMVILFVVSLISYLFRRKLGKRWIILHRISACGLVICLIAHIYFGINSLIVYKNQVSNIAINKIELANKADGEYIGEENVGYIYCKVKVIVEDHKIESIEILEHRTERGKPAEILTSVMVKKQTNKVDAVSGATNSSKVIMKAVENAINNDTK